MCLSDEQAHSEQGRLCLTSVMSTMENKGVKIQQPREYKLYSKIRFLLA